MYAPVALLWQVLFIGKRTYSNGIACHIVAAVLLAMGSVATCAAAIISSSTKQMAPAA
jgi:hypothetical protein